MPEWIAKEAKRLQRRGTDRNNMGNTCWSHGIVAGCSDWNDSPKVGNEAFSPPCNLTADTTAN